MAYAYLGGDTFVYRSYLDDDTGKVLIASPGGTYSMTPVDGNWSVPPNDGRWAEPAAADPPPVWSQPVPAPAPAPEPAPEGGDSE